MARQILCPSNWKILSLLTALALLNLGTKQGWVEDTDEGSGCFGTTTAVVPRLVPKVPASVSFDEGAVAPFTATFEEFANWTISSDNPDLIWEPGEATGSMTVDVTVRLRDDAPALSSGKQTFVVGGAKICATALGSEIEACGWNRARARMATLRGLEDLDGDGRTFSEGAPHPITFSLDDPDPGRVWEVDLVSSDTRLSVENLEWSDGAGTLTLAAGSPPPCNKFVCVLSNLPVTLRFRSGERVIERIVLFTLVQKG